MVSRGVFYLVTAFLMITGLLLMLYQHMTFDIPFLPGEQRTVWTVEAKVEFEPRQNSPLKVFFALPATQPGMSMLNQTTSSLGYGVNYMQRQSKNYVEWTKHDAAGMQVLYYRADFLIDPDATDSSMTVPSLTESVEPEPYATAMKEIAAAAEARSADPFSFTAQVIRELKEENDTTSLLHSKYSRADLLLHILEVAEIHAKHVGVLSLEDGRRNQHLDNRVAVFSGTDYMVFDPQTGVSGLQSNEIIWSDNGVSLLDVSGGRNASVSFSILKRNISAIQAGQRKAEIGKLSGSESVSLSIESLPIEEQSLFKSVLLLPIGVLIVVFLRILIGIKTSGTFMPVLIAMSFLQTSLAVGLIGFVAIVGAGLIIRSWLSHLNLLLVARISAVIIVVIAIIGGISLFTYKIGLTEGLKITFFPMIILSWTIERMSILWEEEGYKEVLKQGGGSLFVAVSAYLAMSSLTMQHITFNFLGLQLVILSLVLLMGNYTGFRLSEMKRFKPLSYQIKKYANGDQDKPELYKLHDELTELKKDPHNTSRKWKNEVNAEIEKKFGAAEDSSDSAERRDSDKDKEVR